MSETVSFYPHKLVECDGESFAVIPNSSVTLLHVSLRKRFLSGS